MSLECPSVEDCLREILIKDIFIEKKKEDIQSNASLRQDLGVDSLGFVELKTQAEACFGIAISDEEFTPENFSTISSLAILINRLRR